ncbi:hypothetical protein BIT28_25095 [Photobacterium proteolyticum]|uniref:Uncharacterized protein n=1 Tax=Photobacterium proteolyticum TaxID=1903952 RepID=A0A1Q9H7B9_9GAMM|nr:hypothetical protein [Photobacterium proteolyticum]OLQ83764.1 hypothetical protein BIT28_25095 [Photobacterium proteolyticum]
MKDSDIEFSKWKLEREKGSLRFTARTAFSGVLGVMIGRSIDPLFISETAWGWMQTTDVLMSGFWASIGAIPVSYAMWCWREKKYKRHVARLQQRT